MRHWIIIKKNGNEVYATMAESYSLYSSTEYDEYEKNWDFYHPVYKLGDKIVGYVNGFGNLVVITDDDKITIEEDWD